MKQGCSAALINVFYLSFFFHNFCTLTLPHFCVCDLHSRGFNLYLPQCGKKKKSRRFYQTLFLYMCVVDPCMSVLRIRAASYITHLLLQARQTDGLTLCLCVYVHACVHVCVYERVCMCGSVCVNIYPTAPVSVNTG